MPGNACGARAPRSPPCSPLPRPARAAPILRATPRSTTWRWRARAESIQWPPPPGLVPGSWSSSTDCTQADRIFPPPWELNPNGWSYAALPTPQETFPGIVSTHAARLRTTSPLVGIWGANLNVEFAWPPEDDGGAGAPPPDPADAGAPSDAQACPQASVLLADNSVDLTAYSGVTFWAMADPTGAKSISVQLQDRNTDPQAGICNAANPTTDSDCWNGFGTGLLLTDTLTQYTLDFSMLQQDPRWGYHPAPDVLDLQHVYSMTFQVDGQLICVTGSNSMCAGGSNPPLSFDFWIDDLYFVKK